MSEYQTELLKPRVVDVQPINDRSAKVSLEPLDRGFGHTLGNALRRVLLSRCPAVPWSKWNRKCTPRVHHDGGSSRGRHRTSY